MYLSVMHGAAYVETGRVINCLCFPYNHVPVIEKWAVNRKQNEKGDQLSKRQIIGLCSIEQAVKNKWVMMIDNNEEFLMISES